MDQLLAIRVFARVVEAGAFTRAADSLDMPLATVSKLVRLLELHLGVRLLQRTTRRVTVTPEGAAYYERTSRVLKEIEDIDSGFASAHQRPRGRLRIDIGSANASCVLIPALPDFIERYPDIRVDLGVSDRQVDLIGDNVDCVVRGGSVDELSLIARPLGRASWVTCAAPDYLKQHGRPTHPDQLKNGHRIVSYVSARTGRVMPMRFQKGSERIEIGGSQGMGVNESNAHVAAGLAGLGVIQTFSFAAKDAITRGELLPVLPAWQPDPYPFFLVYPPDRHMSQRLRVFIDWATERFAHKFDRAT
ncbi:LysR family transcriptional regulator [Paraburkholderia madseniana]|jgi:LysR family transcriptional regulator for bpeEF and oprC|uniref:LysR family transcriptional regulator n=1 Tax=Paraburkholderia madseniana TaxID=2599607 RepID=A0AAP5ENS1_9BURK|nr:MULTISPECIES: LysR family transcriptional regulator [Paraburkholderia]MCX4145957.1 LysR family transcriptional regulator [Paraburkholderia madseniana]MDN7148904.1 LysR family transcriptional regulator [Paraburkholderia sp. WS6]MDQ6407784.1 LysR family transcriptional regulator [Paraburkholderia madseniana]